MPDESAPSQVHHGLSMEVAGAIVESPPGEGGDGGV